MRRAPRQVQCAEHCGREATLAAAVCCTPTVAATHSWAKEGVVWLAGHVTHHSSMAACVARVGLLFPWAEEGLAGRIPAVRIPAQMPGPLPALNRFCLLGTCQHPL